ncbi:MAG: MATE family efflux transporter [Lachnospiraceae bacterium]|nr:MATE family efflux transporter [Candidatus Merdinaster equi]
MNKDLTIGTPSKAIRDFCLPLFGSVIFQQLYNLADSWVAGRFIGEDAIAAIGNSYQVTLIFIAFAFGCNIGCSVIASRFFGAKDISSLKTAVSTSIISSGAICATLMLIGFLFFVPLLHIVNTPENLMPDSVTYMNIYLLGLPFVFFYNISTGIFSALGDSKTPFYFLAASSLSNIGMDILFVQVFNFGVPGIAWATFLCQSVSCILALLFVFKRVHSMKAPKKPALFSAQILRQFIVVAVPSILQQSFISIGNIIIQGSINMFGPGVMAGYSAAVKLNNLIITSLTTFGNGVSNYTAQNLGAQKPERIKPGFIAGVKMVWLISLPICILYLTLPSPLLTFFIKDPSLDAITSGTLYLRILSPFYFVISIKLVADGVLRGAEKMKEFMVTTFSDLIIRVALALLLSGTILGYLGIWYAWPIGWCIATGLSVFFYMRVSAHSMRKSCEQKS